MEEEEHEEKPVSKKVYTSLWACPRQLTHGWGCPTILERMKKFLGTTPDVYFGKTDGIKKGISVDVNPKNKPTVVADWNSLPFRNRVFSFAFWDPPYDRRYNKALEEIKRVTKERIAILHQIVYPSLDGWKKRAIIGITTGPNMRIRCLQIYDRKPKRLQKSLIDAFS